MRKRSVLPGLLAFVLAAVLFSIVVPASLDAGLEWYMFYIVVGFTALGILSGISVGKKMAYTIHDRELMAERLEGRGTMTGIAAIFADLFLLMGVFLLVGWTVFMILLGFLESVVTDAILMGRVRWIAIVAMSVLITASYLFFRARASARHEMLSFWGKEAEVPSDTFVQMQCMADTVEERVRNTSESGFRAAAGVLDAAEEVIHR